MISFTCLHCAKSLRVKDELAGKMVKCPGCGKTFAIPAGSALLTATRSEPGKGSPAAGAGRDLEEDSTLAPEGAAARLDSEAPTVPPGCRDDLIGRPDASADETDGGGLRLPKAVEIHEQLTDFLAPAQQPDEIGRLGPYRVLKVLGHGGMGVVFRAEDPALQRMVAIKAMLPALAASGTGKQRFLREARAAAALKDDHIVSIYQVGEDRGAPFLAMEFLEGEALDVHLQRESRLPMSEVVRIGRETALGLAAAHKRGLIHRDIKPANLWLEGESGRVKILDFGLARVTGDDTHLTNQGTVVGTPAYMAPEQAGGKAIDHRCDLFSLGCVLYRLCTGTMAFKGNDTMAILMSLAVDMPQAPHEVNPAVPRELSALVMQLLAKDPAQRPATAREVADRLEGIGWRIVPPLPAADATTEVPLPPRPRKGRGQAPPRRRLLRIGAVALLLLLPLGYFFGGAVLRIVTNKGELVIESDDPNLEVTVKGTSVTVYDKVKERRFVLTAGDYDIEVREEGDGGVRFATKKMTITRGGKETFNARLELAKVKPPDGKPVDPDVKPVVGADERKAAEWVLSIGGTVDIDAAGKQLEVRGANHLPTEAWQLVSIHLVSNKKVTDAGLAQLKTLTNLKNLNLYGTPVSDAGLAHLQTLTNLTFLRLDFSQVSDAGLIHLKTLSNLTVLGLSVKKVSDAGLIHLKTLTNLKAIYLQSTSVSDAGLEHLWTLTNLTYIDLIGTKVTAAGVDALRKALPKCQIISDFASGGDERQAAEWVLSIGGKVTIRAADKDRKVAEAKDLPTEPFQVVVVYLYGNKQVTDAGLGHLKALTDLRSLDLRATPVSDAGLVHLKGLTKLTILYLNGTGVSDAGLEHLKGLTNLTGLYLASTKVSDAGLIHLKTLTNLKAIQLQAASVSDAGLEHLKTLTNLTDLGLGYTQVSDAGLEHLKTLTNLTEVDLRRTKVTAAGVDALRKSRPKCRIISDFASGGDERQAAEWVLSLGGKVTVEADGKDSQVAETKVLPSGVLHVLSIDLRNNQQVTDAGLEHLKALTNLTKLDLGETGVSDAGLVHLRALTNLTHLNLTCPKVSDAGLVHLKALTNLTYLSLAGQKVSDAGLEHLKALTNLSFLHLGSTKVSDVGLVHLKTLTNLTWLGLHSTEVSNAGLVHLGAMTNLTRLELSYNPQLSDAGLEHLKSLTNLVWLNLNSTQVGDTGLEHLKTLTALTELRLGKTQVSDAGLEHLKALTNLTDVDLRGTKVTAAGVVALRKALPKCEVTVDAAPK